MRAKRPGRKVQAVIDFVSAEVDPRSATIFAKILNKGGCTESLSDLDFAHRCLLRPEKFAAARELLIKADLIQMKSQLGGLASYRLTAKGVALAHQFGLQDRLISEVVSTGPASVPSFVRPVIVSPAQGVDED